VLTVGGNSKGNNPFSSSGALNSKFLHQLTLLPTPPNPTKVSAVTLGKREFLLLAWKGRVEGGQRERR